MCDSHYTCTINMEHNVETKVVNSCTYQMPNYFAIQVLNVQWVADMISGKIILVLKVSGKDTIGIGEYHIILLGKQFDHPILKLPPGGLGGPSKQHDGGVFVFQTEKYTENSETFTPVTYPTTVEDISNLGIFSAIIHPGVLSRINDTSGKITQIGDKVEVLGLEHRVIYTIQQYLKLFGG